MKSERWTFQGLQGTKRKERPREPHFNLDCRSLSSPLSYATNTNTGNTDIEYSTPAHAQQVSRSLSPVEPQTLSDRCGEP